MRFAGQVAIVTGGGQGIGEAIALRLAGEGADIVLAEINPDLTAGVKVAIEALGRRCLGVHCNVADKSAVIDMVEQAITEFAKIDILVNNAGVHQVKALLELTEKDWDFVFSVNAKGVFFCSQAVAPHMMHAQHGKIINVASGAGKRGDPFGAHYAASKSVVISLTQSFALAMAPYHINVNSVCPGLVDTAMWAKIDEDRGALLGLPKGELMHQTVAGVPLGRVANPEDVAGLVAFLASADSDYMTGQAVNINGGIRMD